MANQIAERNGSERLAVRLERLAEEIRRAGDAVNGEKLLELCKKAREGEMSIAFCGHFSAGKSTMINALVGEDLLPSNPIPTSANVVKITGGSPSARVYTRGEGVRAFDPRTEMEALQAFAKDGDGVERVEISYPCQLLDEKTSLLDTPGIDSTDAAHKIATESALHLADAVVYMMDYNHVQAEENFHFTKTLKDRGKLLYLVINMIDKHVDFELDFDSYKESVEEAFATWNIRPDGVYYTSLAEPDHPENQYEAFRAALSALFARREELVADSLIRSASQLIDEHVRFLSRQHAEERRAAEEVLASPADEADGLDAADADAVGRALAEAEAQLAGCREQAESARWQMERELAQLLDNARLTYYSTNEAAERYLESRKPSFKVGFLFSGRKTEQEREARLQALLADFREKVASNLDWHFKELLAKLPEAHGVRDEAYHADVHGWTFEVTPAFLAAHVKEGAVSREYVMNYCKDISDAVKAEYRRAGLAFIERVAERLARHAEAASASLAERIERLRALAAAHESLARLAAREHEARERLFALLTKGE